MEKKWPLDVTVSFDPYFGEPSRDGIQGAEVLPDGKVHFRIIAKDAKEVVIDRFGTIFPLSRVEDEYFAQMARWYGNRFLIYGSQIIQNSTQPQAKRSVYYLQKVQYD